jgi:hypothetical protein
MVITQEVERAEHGVSVEKRRRFIAGLLKREARRCLSLHAIAIALVAAAITVIVA